MTTRRTLLTQAASLAAAGYFLSPITRAWGAGSPGLTYGVQMYMVRAMAATDVASAFRSIKSAGFDQVELYPIAYHQPAAQLRSILADSGLRAVAGHFDYTARESSVEYAHTLGLEYLVCPMLPADQKINLDGFRKAADDFSHWAEATRKAGMQFVFHNHDYEFQPMDGSTGWNVLMQGTSPTLVKLEFDVFWLLTAGQDPAAMLRRHADRAVLIHLKDRVANAPQSFLVDQKAASYCTEMGKGTIDWPALLAQARRQGIRYAYLDQDVTTIPVEQSMRESHAYLRRLTL